MKWGKQMCFSATASFVTAAMTAGAGAASLYRAREVRELPLAATPIVFAAQQAIEGMLWLTLAQAPAAPSSSASTSLFLYFALAFWPIFAPVAVLLIEPNGKRRDFMRVCLGVGIGVGIYMFWHTLTEPHSAVIIGGHVVYVTGLGHSLFIAPAYLVATSVPLLLSSRRTVIVLGATILVGSVLAYLLYWEAFVSVWCFFAAAASLVVLFHFEQAHRRRHQVAAA